MLGDSQRFLTSVESVKNGFCVKHSKFSLDRLKHAAYLGLSIMALFLSACFPAVEKQLIAFSLIVGLKWIVAGRTERINILIKQGDN